MTATDGGSPTTGGGTGGRPLGSAYVVHEVIGRGATGEVWRGADRRTGAPVAVKILRPEFSDDPRIVERLLRERSILSELDGPNIVRLRDLVVEGDTVALVTDLVAGGDLRARLQRDGTLTPTLAVDLACQILEGLEVAHERGVVHRDLKPENVVLEQPPDGTDDTSVVRITDFGIATLAYSSSLTHATTAVGSPEYMAPEVVEAGEVTPALDLYSVGIVLYEMLAGRTPFAGGPPIAVVRRHVEERPPRIPDVRPALWAEIETLLAKDPAHRPPRAAIAARRLARVLDEVDRLPMLPLGVGERLVVDLSGAEPAGAAGNGNGNGSGNGGAPGRAPAPARDSEADTRRVQVARAADEAVHRVGGRASAPPHASRRAWRRAVPALAAAAVLAGGTAVWAARRRDERHRASLTYTAAPVLEPTGAVVTRTLALSGSQGDHLRVVLHVRNPTADRIETVYEPDLTTGRRTTTAPYPVTPYHVRLAAHDSTTVSYSARLGAGDVDMSRLAQLEAQLDASNTTNRLAVAHAGPEVVHLRPQQRAFLNLSGVLARSSTSDLHKLLSSIAWHSSAARVANVEQPDARAVTPDWRPVVVASHPGRATLRAEVGDQSLDVDIVVAGARVAAPSTPCEPGVGDPPGLSTLPDGSSIASPGGGDGHVFVMAGGARLTVDNTSAAALVGVGRDTQTVSDADLAAISTIPRDRTLLQPIDRPGDEWVVVGGAVAPIAATDVQPLGLGTPVRVLQKWLGALPVYAPATFAPRDGTLVTDFDRATTVVRLDGTWHATTDVCPAARVVRLPHSATAVTP